MIRLATLRLQFDKLLGYLVVAALRQDAQDCPPCLVEVDATTQRAPTCPSSPLERNIAQLHHCDAHKSVVAREVVVFDTNVQLERVRIVLVSNNTAMTTKGSFTG